MNLDDPNIYQNLDRSNVCASIDQLGDQILQTYGEISRLAIPDGFTSIKNIVFSGMGGSSLGAYVAKALLGSTLKIPFEIINDYYIPEYVNQDSLVVVQSYSGTTEESLSGFSHAVTKGANIFTIASGGRLEEKSNKVDAVFYKINPLHNPSGQPRMAIGYSIFAILTLFSRIGLFDMNNDEATQILKNTKANNLLWGKEVDVGNNEAKQLAQVMHQKIPVYLAGEHLVGAIHAMRNQFHENAKEMAVTFPIPEADHHLLEALQFPGQLAEDVYFILLQSDLYGERIHARVEKTAEIVIENHCIADTILVTGATRLQQIVNSIQFGAYVAFYSAMLNGLDPAPIPWVENFKKKIA